MNGYDDIIDVEYKPSGRHAKMPRINRAAQFAPFAALTGYGEAINETGRRVDRKPELSEDDKAAIDEKLRFLAADDEKTREICVVYFKKDEKKDGGSFKSFKGVIKRLFPNDRIVFTDGVIVPFEDLIEVAFEGEEDAF